MALRLYEQEHGRNRKLMASEEWPGGAVPWEQCTQLGEQGTSADNLKLQCHVHGVIHVRLHRHMADADVVMVYMTSYHQLYCQAKYSDVFGLRQSRCVRVLTMLCKVVVV